MGDCIYGIYISIVISSKFRLLDRVIGEFKVLNQVGYFVNVVFKWNLKVGGVNYSLLNEFNLIKEGKIMIVGYDVIYLINMFVGKDMEVLFFVGLVVSIDKQLGQWLGVVWEQFF